MKARPDPKVTKVKTTADPSGVTDGCARCGRWTDRRLDRQTAPAGAGSEYVRSWAVYLIAEGRNPSDAALARFAALAKQDSSALVRLYLASALQRVPPEKRWDAVAALLARAEDRGDANQPLMAWYAAEPLAAPPGTLADARRRSQLRRHSSGHGSRP